jgi:hypothetical protein
MPWVDVFVKIKHIEKSAIKLITPADIAFGVNVAMWKEL